MAIATQKELRKQNIRPIKHRGQNFLVSPTVIKNIIRLAQIKAGETILEVGPGTGNLTQYLINSGAQVIAVEKDKELAALLKLKIKNEKLKIIEGDILRFDETTISRPYRIIANIPYYLTGKLIQKFLLSANCPTELILMVQKEVGERLTAKPPKANYLSSLVGFLARSEILLRVNKESFWPRPKVDSVVIKLIPFSSRSGKALEYINFLKQVFRQPRQTLFNNLRKSGVASEQKLETTLKQLKLDKKIRPQNLNGEKLIELYKSIMVY